MNLENISVELKPRSHWQSMDLGFKLAQSQYKPLLLLWCFLALPVYLVLKLIPALGFFAILIWWWLKPLYEAPMHFWLSRAVFQEPVTYRQCLSQLRKCIFTLLKTYLSFWRFGGSRSQNMGVVVVEGARGKTHRKRLSVFTRENTQSSWLTFVCFNFEFILYYSMVLAGSLFLPFYSWRFFTVLPSFQNEFNWYSVFSDVCILASIGVVAPFYVGAGFMLYINRRTHLEAWDIDVDFKRILLRQDNKTSIAKGPAAPPVAPLGGEKFNGSRGAAACIVIFLLSFSNIPPVEAADIPSAEDSQRIIQDILAGKDFGEAKLVKRFKRKDKNIEKEEEQEYDAFFNGLSNVSDAVRLILWFLAIAVAIFLIVYGIRNRAYLSNMISKLGFKRPEPEVQLFDLEISPESLPVDIPGYAHDLVSDGRQREALGLLYRGALSRLVHQYGMQITRSATEQECVEQVNRDQPEIRRSTFVTLTRLWLRSAYTQTVPPDEDITALCSQWPAAFDARVAS